MKKIRKLCSGAFSEANLKLIGLAPSLYDTLLTVIERIENMDSMELSDEARQELIDIQSVVWDTINADGNLCGVAEWTEETQDTPNKNLERRFPKKYITERKE